MMMDILLGDMQNEKKNIFKIIINKFQWKMS